MGIVILPGNTIHHFSKELTLPETEIQIIDMNKKLL